MKNTYLSLLFALIASFNIAYPAAMGEREIQSQLQRLIESAERNDENSKAQLSQLLENALQSDINPSIDTLSFWAWAANLGDPASNPKLQRKLKIRISRKEDEQEDSLHQSICQSADSAFTLEDEHPDKAPAQKKLRDALDVVAAVAGTQDFPIDKGTIEIYLDYARRVDARASTIATLQAALPQQQQEREIQRQLQRLIESAERNDENSKAQLSQLLENALQSDINPSVETLDLWAWAANLGDPNINSLLQRRLTNRISWKKGEQSYWLHKSICQSAHVVFSLEDGHPDKAPALKQLRDQLDLAAIVAETQDFPIDEGNTVTYRDYAQQVYARASTIAALRAVAPQPQQPEEKDGEQRTSY